MAAKKKKAKAKKKPEKKTKRRKPNKLERSGIPRLSDDTRAQTVYQPLNAEE